MELSKLQSGYKVDKGVTFEVFRDKSGEDKSVAMNARILVLVKGGQQRSVGAIRQSGVGPCGAGNRRPRK